MDSACQNSDFSSKYLLGQLNIARKEINNLRQQIKSLRYIHEKDVDSIKRLLDSYRNGPSASKTKIIGSDDVKPSTSTDEDTVKLKPIGVISTWFPSKRGTPRQTRICGKVPGKLLLYNSVFTNPDHALEGLQDFSHMWVLFYFHRNDSTHVRAKVAPPRLNGTKTGVFSTRSPHRPCPIGLSLVKITTIENHTIYFEGVDMVDQSPVLDIKPYIPQYDSPLYFEKLSNRLHESNLDDAFECIEETTRNQSLGDEPRSLLSESYYRKPINKANQEADVSRDEEIALRLQAEEFQRNSNFESYSRPNISSEIRIPEWISRPRTPLCVVFNDRALIQLNEILGTKINDQKVAIENVLREDPRSVYLRQRWGSQFYTFLIHDLHITCRFDDNRGIVTVFQVRHAGRICECGEPEWQCLGHSPPSS
ncbi:Nef-associated protein 1 [Melipona quadrifasciata]|uniref:Nef-associated protein 1 n=1 Tax=Melipona quadrifasciata TaxID=166423 RepID=A0A0M8ZUX9_9HYME|nr:Nef-associated protein 1 [Melipona quadrifasciata]